MTNVFDPPPHERDFPKPYFEARKRHLISEMERIDAPKARRPLAALTTVLHTNRRLAVGAAVLMCVVLAAPALAVVRAVHGMFEGTPPTPIVTQHFELWNTTIARTAAPGARDALSRLPSVDPATIHGVLVDTTDGVPPLYLWSASASDGRDCWFMQIGNEPPDSTPYGPSGCFARPPDRTVRWGAFPNEALPGHTIVFGRTDAATASVELLLADGSIVRAAAAEGFFLATTPADSDIVKVTALDAEGNTEAVSNHPG